VLTLRPLVAADLPALEHWFNDDDTRHWLGDRRWPSNKLGMSGPSHHAMLGVVDGQPVGLVDIEVDADYRAAFAIVVAPDQRRRGLGRTMVEACLADPRFDDVCEWFAGVETGNIASQQLLVSCGFARMTDEDADGFSYFARRLSGWPRLPWRSSWSALPEVRRSGLPKLSWGRSAA
jgi:ribosomal protein S18 acetylase RimI-like enzyme